MDKHEGWYSVSDETFYPSSQVHLTIDPPTGRKIMSSIETGKEVEWTSENNYRFRLSSFKNQLLSFYKRSPRFIRPPNRMDVIIKEVESGLEDLSISRPRSRLTWGIPVPKDDFQTIYVWLDALINYATKAGYPWAPGSEKAGGWPADIQLIGKDIMRRDYSVAANRCCMPLTSIQVPLHLLARLPHGSRSSSSHQHSHPRTLDARPRENGKVHRQRRQPILRYQSLRQRCHAFLPRPRRWHRQ